MSAEHVEARPGAYADSVTLMRISADVQRAEGVQAALIAMATELNLGLLPAMGFEPPPAAGPNHLLIAIRASGESALAGALAAVDAALTARPRTDLGAAGMPLPRTTGAAVRTSGPGLALISVPGQYAFAEAMDALDAGCDVMIFSDNVPVEQEIVLKDIAAQRDLLVMGPDCGTAVDRRRRAGLRAHARRRAGRAGRRVRHRRAAGAVPAGPRGRRDQRRARRRRPRPVRRRGRPVSPRRAGRARRRSGHRAHRRGIQAAGPGRGREAARLRGGAGDARAVRLRRVLARRTSPRRPRPRCVPRACRSRPGHAGRARRTSRGPGRCAACSPAARSATRPWSSRRSGSGRSSRTSRCGQSCGSRRWRPCPERRCLERPCLERPCLELPRPGTP